MKIDVSYVAKLARINLTDAEIKRFSVELDKILDYFRELNEVKTDAVEPLSGGTMLTDVVRDDVVIREVDPRVIRKEFPDSDDELLRVPEVFSD